jgi:thioredoxin reductase
MTTSALDVIIVGAGSAGLSAALMLARSRRQILVVDGGDPRNAVAPHMHGVLGREGWSPLELVATGREEVARYGGVVEEALAFAIALKDDQFTLTLDDGQKRRARRVLIASGLRDELPEIPGLLQFWGRGVAHCPYCDGWEWRDRRIAVVSTGPASLHQAQLMRQLSADVTYYVEGTDLPEADLAALVARGITIETRRVAAIESLDNAVSAVRLHDGAVLKTDVIFVRPRALPNDPLLRMLKADSDMGVDGQEWVTVDPAGRTSIPGLWAAGNVVSPSATVPVSAAAGSTAGAAINADLVNDEIQSALRANDK